MWRFVGAPIGQDQIARLIVLEDGQVVHDLHVERHDDSPRWRTVRRQNGVIEAGAVTEPMSVRRHPQGRHYHEVEVTALGC